VRRQERRLFAGSRADWPVTCSFQTTSDRRFRTFEINRLQSCGNEPFLTTTGTLAEDSCFYAFTRRREKKMLFFPHHAE
jgi:hypothetical protein